MSVILIVKQRIPNLKHLYQQIDNLDLNQKISVESIYLCEVYIWIKASMVLQILQTEFVKYESNLNQTRISVKYWHPSVFGYFYTRNGKNNFNS